MASFDVAKARSHFPSLNSGFIFADNAGGSQAAKEVVDRVSDYLLNANVQLGGNYSVAAASTDRVLVQAPTDVAHLFNAHSPDEIVFGSSSTMNLENLARGLEKGMKAGDEFIVTGEHESNVGPWTKLATRTGGVIKRWSPTPTTAGNPYSLKYDIAALLPLITARTRIVAFCASSNILGSIVPVKEVVKAVRAEAVAKGATKVELSVDCVAYAPYRSMDVQDWDVDFCVISLYKVYGPHVSALYVRAASLEHSVHSLAHHFLKVNKIAYKLQPGGPAYESIYGATGVIAYLRSLTPQNNLRASYDAMASQEQVILRPLIDFLTDDAQRARGVRIIGEETVSSERISIVSFVVVGEKPLESRAIVSAFDKKGGVGIRYGHFYAFTLINNLSPKIGIDDGVVRISLVHYNTVQEVDKIISILKEVLEA